LFQVDVSEIIAQEADKPNAVIDFFQSEFLRCPMKAQAAAMCDDGVAVVEG
jgi:hypothetical protein